MARPRSFGRPAALAPLAALLTVACAARAPEPAGRSERAVEPARKAASALAEAEPVAAAAQAAPAAEGQAAAPPAAPVDARPRIGAVEEFAYIYKRAERRMPMIGYVRIGTSVPLKTGKPVKLGDCKGGFYEVEPRGFVCLDRRTTLDLDDPYFKALAAEAPKKGVAWPYTYAYSLGAPMYSRVPTEQEWKKVEENYAVANKFVTLGEWAKGHEELVQPENPPAVDPVPADLFDENGKRKVSGGARSSASLVWRSIPNGSMLSYSKAFSMRGRTWLLTPDLMLVPADRTRVQRRSSFKGTLLEGTDLQLPFAWNREKTPIKKYARDASGAFTAMTGDEGEIPAKAFVEIGDERVKSSSKTYAPLRREPSAFVDVAEVTITAPRKELPKTVGERDKWIEVKVAPGTLTAYVGSTPVMATLFSPGKGGVAPGGRSKADHEKYATTKPGLFHVEWKDHVAWMSPDEGAPKTLWMADVPHIQYLEAPLAMHVAYWHADFGKKKSAECVNISPEDGKWLFGWTDPPLPEGWGGIKPGDGNGPSTAVHITGY